MATALRRGLTPVRTVLDNGAVVLVQETSTIPAVTLMATFLAGSVDDPAGTPGLAYMMGRLLDRGTERRAGEVIAQELDDRGVSLKVSTSRHTMSLSCTCLAEDFDHVIGIVLEVATRPVFPEPEIVKRRGEIITALRQDEDNPAVRATETLFELLYGASHPYGRRPKGTVASIERIERVDLIALHRARIRPGTLSLTVVGDVRPEHALARAARELDGWDGAASDEMMVPPPPSADGRRVAITPMPVITTPKAWPMIIKPIRTPIVDRTTADNTRRTLENLLNCASRMAKIRKIAAPKAFIRKAPALARSSSSPFMT